MTTAERARQKAIDLAADLFEDNFDDYAAAVLTPEQGGAIKVEVGSSDRGTWQAIVAAFKNDRARASRWLDPLKQGGYSLEETLYSRYGGRKIQMAILENADGEERGYVFKR